MDEAWIARELRPRFSRVLARGGIYLANHSLGRPPDRAAKDVCAVLNALPGKPRVAASDGEFDSLDFILRAYRERDRIALRVAPWRELEPAGADLVVLSTVMFRSGERVDDLAARVRAAHAAGARVLLDVYHHAGVLPLDLAALEADFAVGGSYKYTRGGPGACWLYVRPGLVDTLRTLDTGWFAKRDVFAYQRPDPPQYGAGGDAWLESTPPVLAPVQALAGLELTLEVGVARLREHNLAQKARLAALIAALNIETQGAGETHGAFLTVRHPAAARVAQRLGALGVSADARGDALRLCPDFLNTKDELAEAARRLRVALDDETA